MTRVAPTQENQGVRHRPQSLEWSIIGDEFFHLKLEFFGRIVRDC